MKGGETKMPVLTDELRKLLPPLHSQEKEKDPLLICKYYMPLNKWVWYPIEFDGEDTFFGYVVGDNPELGYFTLSKLERITEAYGLIRDDKYQSTRLSEVKKVHEPWLYE
jgi:hypothetical protein